VLVNDPSRGYGTFAEWMARDAYMMTGRDVSLEGEAEAAFLEMLEMEPGRAESADSRR
jgi:hypothetical protein